MRGMQPDQRAQNGPCVAGRKNHAGTLSTSVWRSPKCADHDRRRAGKPYRNRRKMTQAKGSAGHHHQDRVCSHGSEDGRRPAQSGSWTKGSLQNDLNI